MIKAMEAFAASMFTQEAWPFWATVLIFTVIGQFTSLKLFTRERAYATGKMQWFWWWGRETLMLHPIASGIVLGMFWKDPQNAGWPDIASQAYFGAAGVISLGAWAMLKGILKKRGIKVVLPGMSGPPSPPPPAGA